MVNPRDLAGNVEEGYIDNAAKTINIKIPYLKPYPGTLQDDLILRFVLSAPHLFIS